MRIGGGGETNQPVLVGGGCDLNLDNSLDEGELTIVAGVIEGGGNAGSFTEISADETVDLAIAIDAGATDSENRVKG